jgi:hypothetical protein
MLGLPAFMTQVLKKLIDEDFHVSARAEFRATDRMPVAGTHPDPTRRSQKAGIRRRRRIPRFF